jgi:ABC-type dipeptide/oligopeptide/nickel transport system permease subunit
MGTNALGQDLRPRFFFGGAISLSLGIASALIAILIGTSVGLLAGYVGGRTDATLMRIVDILYGLPYILLVMIMRVSLVPYFAYVIAGTGFNLQRLHLLSASLPDSTISQWSNFLVLLVGIGSVSWLTLARVVRGQVLSLRDQPFIEAARALGFPARRIIARHILPNILGTIIVYGTLTVPAAVLSESFLSFLGLGIQPPIPSWGNLASEGMEALNPVRVQWWMITWPCAALSLALLALNFVGDGIREAFDPRSQ